jgi:hypothetical protein
MKFSIGDKIVLKRTGEEGVVTAYINQQMLEVEVNGTVFPVYADEVDHPYLNWFIEQKKQKKVAKPLEQIPVEKEKNRPKRLPKGVYLSFIPVFKAGEMEDIVDHLKVHLLNELSEPISFTYDVRIKNSSLFSHEGKLHAFGNVYLHNIPFEDMNDQPRFNWKLSTSDAFLQEEEGTLRIKPVKLFERIGELLQNNEPSFSYILIEDFKPVTVSFKKQEGKKSIPQANVPVTFTKVYAEQPIVPSYEVDLHIEKILDDYKGLSNAEILDIQLRTLQKQIDAAIATHQERMMVIHGLGKGVLKEEVHKLLKTIPQVVSFNNDWQARYGFGATEVIFSY